MGNVCSLPCAKKLRNCCSWCWQCKCCNESKGRRSDNNVVANPISAGLVMAPLDETDCK